MLDPKALRIKQTIRGSSGAFALDDYGSGYSNERSLLELSPNYIKIDLSIIRDIDTDANKRQIVSNTVSYAHQRGMKVVAAGVRPSAGLLPRDAAGRTRRRERRKSCRHRRDAQPER